MLVVREREAADWLVALSVVDADGDRPFWRGVHVEDRRVAFDESGADQVHSRGLLVAKHHAGRHRRERG